MSECSTKQIDAVWIVHSAKSEKCYLKAIFSEFEDLIGPYMRMMTTILITQCDMAMKKGDYFQYPDEEPFKVPEFYNKLKENIRKNYFWVKIMKPD
jgi:hypothetical protein